MTITKRIEAGQITRLADGQIQYREDTIIEEDGVEISRTYHRETVDPKDNISSTDARGITRPKELMDAVSLFHTTEIKAARLAFLTAQNLV